MNDSSQAALLLVHMMHESYRRMLEEAHRRLGLDQASTAMAVSELNERRIRLSRLIGRARAEREILEIIVLAFVLFYEMLPRWPVPQPQQPPQSAPGVPPEVTASLNQVEELVVATAQWAREAGIATARIERFSRRMDEARREIERTIIIKQSTDKLTEALLLTYKQEFEDCSRALWGGPSLA